ncbi:MAG: Transcription elongation factor GreA [Candidatus Uhrbacteria bacterium GW2011_GWE2_46_68]|nr:MAG: Transcription elongation factor GreA [Candidatus Uhrbacteria bacterium GW2011_GWE2_46_68]
MKPLQKGIVDRHLFIACCPYIMKDHKDYRTKNVFMPTYVSQKGLDDLKKEFEKRKAARMIIAEKIGDAKELGDLSENFEYHAAKEEQGLNEARMAQLEEMIKDSVMISEQKGGTIITLGTSFKISCDGEEKRFEMVGSAEAHPFEGKISNESPLGASFMGHKVGDTVNVDIPSGTKTYQILEIT